MRYGLFGKSIGIGRMVPAAVVVVLDVQEKSFAISNPHWDDALC